MSNISLETAHPILYMSCNERRLVEEAASVAERVTGTVLTAVPSGKLHAERETESIKKYTRGLHHLK